MDWTPSHCQQDVPLAMFPDVGLWPGHLSWRECWPGSGNRARLSDPENWGLLGTALESASPLNARECVLTSLNPGLLYRPCEMWPWSPSSQGIGPLGPCCPRPTLWSSPNTTLNTDQASVLTWPCPLWAQLGKLSWNYIRHKFPLVHSMVFMLEPQELRQEDASLKLEDSPYKLPPAASPSGPTQSALWNSFWFHWGSKYSSQCWGKGEE